MSKKVKVVLVILLVVIAIFGIKQQVRKYRIQTLENKILSDAYGVKRSQEEKLKLRESAIISERIMPDNQNSFVEQPVSQKIKSVDEQKVLDEAIAKYNTPFIDDYRERYYANNFNKFWVRKLALDSCDKRDSVLLECRDEDVANLKELALAGDMAALALYPDLRGSFVSGYETREQRLKYAADMGELVSILRNAYSIGKEDLEKGLIYINMAKSMGYIPAYSAEFELYKKKGMYKEYCETIQNGYEKYGLRFITFVFLDSSKNEDLLLKCYGETWDDILKRLDTDEAKLIQAYIYMYNYFTERKAFRLFEILYNESDNRLISVNAGYCLGAMYYSGIATEKDINKGMKLIRESITQGYLMGTPNKLGLDLLPYEKVAKNYLIDLCGKFVK